MRPNLFIPFLTLLIFASSDVHAGSVSVFTDIDEWRVAASAVGTGMVHEIDFETLPDGSPSFSGALITSEFNYSDQGVFFSPAAPILQIAGNPISGFNLRAGVDGSGGPRNWIIADLITPSTALGVLFPGGTSISIFDADGALIALENFGVGGLHQFGGFISDVPIGSVIVDRGIEAESIESFLFTPIPEPTTFLLLATGWMIVLRRRRY